MAELKLKVLKQSLSICKFKPDRSMPAWAIKGSFFSLTKTPNELSIVTEQKYVPKNVKSNSDWIAIKVLGPLDLSLIGITASLTRPLAQAGVNIFAISTYDTDYILVKKFKLKTAVKALKAAGFTVN